MPQNRNPAHCASALMLACSLLLSGCATNPYDLRSDRLKTFGAAAGTTGQAQRPKPLAGDLDLALVALMDQREQLWQGAGQVETMKNLTAIGLMGVAAAGIYRGLEGAEQQGWLRRAGLASATVYGAALWLEPDARQQVYLQGAMALTCLALITAPYEMPASEFKAARTNLATGRAALERVFSLLRMVGKFGPKGTHERFIIEGAWKRAQFADRAFTKAEEALGSIAQVGPRLRDETALNFDQVARQVHNVSRRLSDLPAAIAALKVDAAKLVPGASFEPPKEGAPDTGQDDDDTKGGSKEAGKACAAPADKATPEVQKKVEELLKQAKEAQAAAEKAAQEAKAAAKPPVAAAPAVSASAPALEPGSAADLAAQIQAIRSAMDQLNQPLGKAISMLRTLHAARAEQQLPKACSEDTRRVTLLPETRDITLTRNESFQFVFSGDTGAPQAQFLTLVPSEDVLSLSLPLGRAVGAVRITAGPNTTGKEVRTIVRLTDSKGGTTADVAVRVCSGS